MFDDPLRTIAIEHVTPSIDDGRHPIKREVGDKVIVEADVFKDGHDQLAAVVLYRREQDSSWSESPLVYFDNDRWRGEFTVTDVGRYVYAVEAWTDVYGTWLHEVQKKVAAGDDIASELLEGRRVIAHALSLADGTQRRHLEGWLVSWDSLSDQAAKVQAASEEAFVGLIKHLPDRTRASRSDPELQVVVDPVHARFASWYEMFVRSQGTDPKRSATLREAEARIPEIADMGFDVLYVPPVHPIGAVNRKGRNNSRMCQPGEPGCPYAIGSKHGGHMAIDPDLGTLDDFDHFVGVCRDHGMRVAIDFAAQCAPDHPYAIEHPEWFFRRPDGSIKYAENPPKKYEDIYPLDFQSEAWESLWNEMRRIFEFWIGHGVTIFRVDNPHTKPLPFWKWLINTIKAKHPEVLFFAEAFTRPKMMRALAKLGFSMSYTYFTWRDTKQELAEYFTELTQTEMKEYYRANFFTNTPDILPFFLQQGGRPAFKIRAVLAATGSSLWGIYNGFELCENRALPGREEYINSEKYEYKVWDWDRPGNIKDYIRRLNTIRLQNPALQEYENLHVFASNSPDILAYGKATAARDNAIIVVVNVNPFHVRESMIHIPPPAVGRRDHEAYTVHDLLTGNKWTWHGSDHYVRLDPHIGPAHIFRIEPA